MCLDECWNEFPLTLRITHCWFGVIDEKINREMEKPMNGISMLIYVKCNVRGGVLLKYINIHECGFADIQKSTA